MRVEPQLSAQLLKQNGLKFWLDTINETAFLFQPFQIISVEISAAKTQITGFFDVTRSG